MEYTIILTMFALVTVLLDEFVFKTKMYLYPRFWYLLLATIILQTIFDNWLNGRWWYSGYIVGPYKESDFSGIIIWNTPLENYFYGIFLVWMNVSFFEYLGKKFGSDEWI